MVQLIDLSGHVEEGQPVLSNQQTAYWPVSTHEASGHKKQLALGEGEEETEAIWRRLRASRSGDPGPHVMDRGVVFGEHGPTHVDALCHLDSAYDETIDRMDLEWFYGPAVGLDVSAVTYEDFITRERLETALEAADLRIEAGDTVTLHTGHRQAHYSTDDVEAAHAYLTRYPGLDEEAANWLGEAGVKNVGIDAPSIDHAKSLADDSFVAHNACAAHRMLNMENLANLDAVAGRRFTISAFPLKLRDGTGSPIRPVAIVEDGS